MLHSSKTEGKYVSRAQFLIDIQVHNKRISYRSDMWLWNNDDDLERFSKQKISYGAMWQTYMDYDDCLIEFQLKNELWSQMPHLYRI